MKHVSLKKISALLLAVLVCLSLCGCSVSSKAVGYVTAPDGTEYKVSRGLYRMVQLTATAVAATEIDPEGAMSVEELLAAPYEGTTVREWVQQRTEQALVRYMVVERCFEENGGEFDDVDMYYYKATIDESWDMYAKLYLASDVDRDGFSSYQYNMLKEYELPYLLGAQDGPAGISDAEVASWAAENTARAEYIAVGITDAQGVPLTGDVRSTLQDMLSRLSEDAAGMGMEAAWEKHALDIRKLLGADITAEDSAVATAYFTPDAGVYSETLVQAVHALEEGETAFHTESDGSMLVLHRTGLQAEENADALRLQYLAVEGGGIVAEYVDAQLSGWSFTLKESAAERYAPDTLDLG